MIDDLFILIINNSDSISNEFYEVLDRLGFNYNEKMLLSFKKENVQAIKEIVYTLYKIYIDNFKDVLDRINREELINLYKSCKTFETDDFISYYKKAIFNRWGKQE